MSNVVHFVPRRELDAAANLKEFVRFCRTELLTLGKELPFDEDTWDLSAHIQLKSAAGNAVRAIFSSWDAARLQKASPPMPEPFLSFAKGYIRYQHALRPTKAFAQRLAALRALCAVLQEHGTADPSRVDPSIFNRACQLISEHFSGETAYRTGMQLEMLATFIDDNRLGAVPLQWKNTAKRPAQATSRVGAEFDHVRESMLPSPDALDALARCFRLAEDPRDVIVTSLAGLLCSAPDRINEILRLKARCEVTVKKPNQPDDYGLQFWTSKGADPMIKWVVRSMAGVVREALERLRKHTESAREVATWYEANPGMLFLPAHLEHLRGRSELSFDEVAEMLFESPRPGTGVTWCRENAIPRHNNRVSFADVERAALKKLPFGFPVLDAEVGTKYSEALCVLRRNQLHEGRATYWGLVEPLNHGHVATGLGNRSEHGFPSVFDRLGFKELDGSPIAIRTHQFRHYLNTLAQQGGMSELDIAKWSGRKDQRQNSAYNHVSDRDIQARIADLKSENGDQPGQLVPQSRLNLIPRSKFAELKIEAAHTTELGFCVHDYAMSPCQLHMDCMNCNEQVCVKGDAQGEATARTMLVETATLLEQARAADREGLFGADQWVKHQELTHERLSQLVSILDDPRYPEGALIRLTHIKPASRLRQAVEARAVRDNSPQNERLTWEVLALEGPR